MPACARLGVYVPRQTHDCDAAMLVRQHLAGFLERLEESGHGPPEYVKAEPDGFAGCGDFARGFVRTACRTCGDELPVPFAFFLRRSGPLVRARPRAVNAGADPFASAVRQPDASRPLHSEAADAPGSRRQPTQLRVSS